MKKVTSKKRSIRFSKRLATILVVGIGLLSLFVYLATSRDYISATDSTGTFSFEYPENWTIEPYVWEDCCEGPAKKEPDWNKESKPITLHPIADKEAVVSIRSDKYGGIHYWKSFKAVVASVKEDYFAKILFDGRR